MPASTTQPPTGNPAKAGDIAAFKAEAARLTAILAIYRAIDESGVGPLTMALTLAGLAGQFIGTSTTTADRQDVIRHAADLLAANVAAVMPAAGHA